MTTILLIVPTRIADGSCGGGNYELFARGLLTEPDVPPSDYDLKPLGAEVGRVDSYEIESVLLADGGRRLWGVPLSGVRVWDGSSWCLLDVDPATGGRAFSEARLRELVCRLLEAGADTEDMAVIAAAAFGLGLPATVVPMVYFALHWFNDLHLWAVGVYDADAAAGFPPYHEPDASGTTPDRSAMTGLRPVGVPRG